MKERKPERVIKFGTPEWFGKVVALLSFGLIDTDPKEILKKEEKKNKTFNS